MGTTDYFSTWVEVDLNAIENNVRLIARRSGVQVMAIVKANAYGHGARAVARAALRAGATWLGVARLEEALELRRAGLDCPILLLGYTPLTRFEEAIGQRLSLTVWNLAQLEAAFSASRRVGEKARLHLKVDTGMGRLGVQAEDAAAFARQMVKFPDLIFEGLFTHLARADDPIDGPTEKQMALFSEVLQSLEAAGVALSTTGPLLVHAANSAASLTRPDACFNLVRTGIAMYGLHPSAQCFLPAEYRPALSWKTVLSQVKTLPAGRGISYGHEYTTAGEERIGTVPLGYADGFRRVKGNGVEYNEVLVNGRRVPVIGRVCMDQLMVQLDATPQANAGDEVVVIGEQGEECIRAEEVARRWETVNYEVVCGISSRVPRLYG
jgi:alanine racemase